jgi:hypothetical protein
VLLLIHSQSGWFSATFVGGSGKKSESWGQIWAKKNLFCCGQLSQLTAYALLHSLCMDAWNNPTMCYWSCIVNLVGSVPLLWVNLVKNLSPAAKSELKICCAELTAYELLHSLCMDVSNNPTMCYCSSIVNLVGSVSLLWVELRKNQSPPAWAKNLFCCGHLGKLTAYALLHTLCMGVSNNPTMCYWSCIVNLVGSVSLLWVDLVKNPSPAAKSEQKICCAVANWANSLPMHCFILSSLILQTILQCATAHP